MGGLFGKGKRVNQQTPIATNLRVQTSVQGRPLAIGAGQNRASGNVVWYGDFRAAQAKAQGGKGGGGSGKGASGQYNYYASFIVSLGQGPISAFQSVYNGNEIDFLVPPTAQVLADLAALGITPTYGNTYGATFILGDYVQAPWSYLTTSHPGQALAYRGEALFAVANMGLGSSPTLPNFSYEVLWGLNSDIPALGPDANPADWVTSFLTDPDWGIGFPAGLLGPLDQYRSWARATGMLVSPVLTDQTAANSHLKDLMQGTVAEFRWSGGLLDIVPYGEHAVTGNGYTYTPDVTPVYDLTLDHLMAVETDPVTPVKTSRKDPSTILNKVQVEYLDRSNLYNPVTIYDADDPAIVAAGRERLSDLRALHYFCLGSAASLSASLQLRREKVANTYSFQLPAQFELLDALDIVTLTVPGTALQRRAVRITEIDEQEDRSLVFTAEEFLGTVGAPLYGRQASLGSARNNNQDPGGINPPLIFEPTDELGGGLEIWGAVAGADLAIWGGCFVWACYEADGTYQLVGEILGASRMGTLTAPLPAVTLNVAGATIDNANTLAVDLTASLGSLLGGSQGDMLAANTRCYVDGEVVAYQNATLTGANAYSLAPLLRGAYGSTIASHAAGTSFARLDDRIFALAYTQDRIGATVYLKFQSFNVYGGGLQDLSDLSPYTYVITGAALASPLPSVANIRTVFDSGFQRLYWDEINDFRTGIRYKIRKGASWTSALEIADVAHPGFVLFGNDTFWVAGYCQPAPGLVVYSETPVSITIAGNMLVQNIIRTSDQKAEGWPGTFTGCGKEGLDPNAIIRLTGAGDFLSNPNILNTPDILNYGGVIASGTYEISAADIVDVGYVANCPINVSWVGTGAPVGQDILSVTDFLALPDVLGSSSSAFVDVHVEIAVDANPSTGAFGAWQKFVPGVYTGRRFKFRLVLSTIDAQSIAYALSFSFQVTVPARLDHYQGLAVPPGGLAIVFQPDGAAVSSPFNGGPDGQALPFYNINWPNSTGDTYTITAFTTAGLTVNFFDNAGNPVARTASLTLEGY